MKFGGTSVGTPERMRAVAERVVRARRGGDDVLVVVSAMGNTTDELARLAVEVTGSPLAAGRHPRETDMLLTAGERISMALLAMAICEAGEKAVSFTGSQAAIITDEAHTAAHILEVRADRLRAALDSGVVVIVAGFQGVSREREVTTLGRGGSDTTAVALAAALGADRCQIFTDVDGVFTADPRRVPAARRIPVIGYADMIELASAGAQVLHPRAVEIAERSGVQVQVLSSFAGEAAEETSAAGTLVTSPQAAMEELALTGITAAGGQAKLLLRHLPAGLRTVSEILSALAEAGVSVDMVSEVQTGGDHADLQISVAEDVLGTAVGICGGISRRMGGENPVAREGLSRLALVGSGMHNRPGVYARTFRALLDGDIEVHAVSTSAISITLLVAAEHEERALNALHAAFELGTRQAGEVRTAT